MKLFNLLAFFALIIFLSGCREQQPSFTKADKEIIKNEVKDQFTLLVSSLNKLDAGTWSEFYSKDEFLSAIVSSDYYAKRGEWIELITNYFSLRKQQKVEIIEVQVTPLAQDLALMTSEDKTEMVLADDTSMKVKHLFTIIWKKETEGWKILHSHESWIETK